MNECPSEVAGSRTSFLLVTTHVLRASIMPRMTAHDRFLSGFASGRATTVSDSQHSWWLSPVTDHTVHSTAFAPHHLHVGKHSHSSTARLASMDEYCPVHPGQHLRSAYARICPSARRVWDRNPRQIEPPRNLKLSRSLANGLDLRSLSTLCRSVTRSGDTWLLAALLLQTPSSLLV